MLCNFTSGVQSKIRTVCGLLIVTEGTLGHVCHVLYTAIENLKILHL
jgi:hypothetical protein